ncbi:MAG: hypothetical protein Q8R00_04335 [Candidatus Nanoarchaeia archaeon]|nr:hypothetical protein [Candidatus Nanoarchaeia archaeon]
MKFLFILLISVLLLLAGCTNRAEKYAELQSCLAEKGVIMYGVEWCPVCAKQKKDFGTKLEGVYFECLDNPEKCLDEKIEGYPTWKFPSGEVYVGILNPEEVAAKASCNCDCSGEVCLCG